MIGCEVFAQVICEVESGPSIYEADPTAILIDIKISKRAKSLQIVESLPLLLLVPSFHQRKNEENLPWIDDLPLLLQPRRLAPAPASLCRSSSTKKGLEHLQIPQSLLLPGPPNPSTKKGKTSSSWSSYSPSHFIFDTSIDLCSFSIDENLGCELAIDKRPGEPLFLFSFLLQQVQAISPISYVILDTSASTKLFPFSFLLRRKERKSLSGSFRWLFSSTALLQVRT
ncbi:hypothetical protein MRB53_019998 [Persea americana]|uniref:Uncharacterized protein n=1 Tax=Persea americana TaxID=3435 RepID=A0ACC2L0L1_PERAE|nr:hypothetical protein MRB53_019998 [Persea americana]